MSQGIRRNEQGSNKWFIWICSLLKILIQNSFKHYVRYWDKTVQQDCCFCCMFGSCNSEANVSCDSEANEYRRCLLNLTQNTTSWWQQSNQHGIEIRNYWMYILRGFTDCPEVLYHPVFATGFFNRKNGGVTGWLTMVS